MSSIRDGERRKASAPPDLPQTEAKVPTAPPEPAAEFSINFETFAESEAEVIAREPRSKGAPALAPERRAVVARNWLPPGDSIVESRPVGSMTVVTLRGRINEAFRGAELGQSLRGAVVFDLSHVDRISSFGVKGWLQMMERARFSACYLFRCSEAVIHQITMMRNFCGVARIHSLLVPYQCSSCGEEFSPVYEAVADRELLRGRSPVSVECPRCSAASAMVEDPWAYLSLDDHLLGEVPPDLQQVVEYLVQPARTDALEKFVSERETRIRIHAPLDGRLRLSRALSGLEGRVVFDVSPRPDASPQAAERLLDAIRQLDDDVTEVWIDGANRAIIQALLDHPVRRTFVSTAFVTLVTPSGARRPVLVDVRRKRAALLRGEVPVLDGVAAARGDVPPEDLEIIYVAARQLVATRLRTTTLTPDLADPRTDSPPTRIIAPPAPPRPAGLAVANWQIPLAAAAIVALGALAFVLPIAAVMGTIGDRANPSAGASVNPSAWDGINPLPPEWAEKPVTVDSDGLRVSGMAKGETAEAAADRSRTLALFHLVRHVAHLLQTTEAASALGSDPGEGGITRVVETYIADVGAEASPERIDHAVKHDELGYTVATRYYLPQNRLDHVVDYYRRTYNFRGLTLGRRFPFQPSAPSKAVVVSVATWFSKVSPGDAIVQVDNTEVRTLEDVERTLEPAYKRLEPGQSVPVYVLHDGNRVRLDFTRPEPELLPLQKQSGGTP